MSAATQPGTGFFKERRAFEALRDATMFLFQHAVVMTEADLVELREEDVAWARQGRDVRLSVKIRGVGRERDRVGRAEGGTAADLLRYRRIRDRFLERHGLMSQWEAAGKPLFVTARGGAMATFQYVCAVRTLPARQPDLEKLPIEYGFPWRRMVEVRRFIDWCFRPESCHERHSRR